MIGTTVLTALGRLNTHARSPGGHQQRSAIYAYKTLAALTLSIDGPASLRFIKWTGKCSRCTDGRFSHWEWDDGHTVACREALEFRSVMGAMLWIMEELMQEPIAK